jgi:membrane-bound lytic murein transglycosylase D
MDVNLAARLAGVSTSEFTQLNPAHKRPVLTASNGTQSILLPVGTEDTFATNLANYNKPLVSWHTYYAKRGERLSSVARKYGISVAQLQEDNDISTQKRLQSNQPLLIPASHDNEKVAGSNDQQAIATATKTGKAEIEAKPAATSYVVKKGDTPASIAKNHGISTKQLLTLNHLKAGKLHIGQTLAVNQSSSNESASKPVTARLAKTAAKPEKTRYIVKRGETLASIARKFNVATSDLHRWNKINGSRITPGHALTIYRPDAA